MLYNPLVLLSFVKKGIINSVTYSRLLFFCGLLPQDDFYLILLDELAEQFQDPVSYYKFMHQIKILSADNYLYSVMKIMGKCIIW